MSQSRNKQGISGIAVILSVIVFLILATLGFGGRQRFESTAFPDVGIDLKTLIALGGSLLPILIDKFGGKIPGIKSLMDLLSGSQQKGTLSEIVEFVRAVRPLLEQLRPLISLLLSQPAVMQAAATAAAQAATRPATHPAPVVPAQPVPQPAKPVPQPAPVPAPVAPVVPPKV